MTAIVMHLSRKDNQSLGNSTMQRLSSGTLVIGRGKSCDWILEDRDRNLSRKHCEVSLTNGLITVRDLSSNGVYLNDQPDRMVRNEPTPVKSGDQLRVGGYTVTIEEEPQSGGANLDMTVIRQAGGAAGGKQGPTTEDPFGAFLEGASIDRDTLSAGDSAMAMYTAGKRFRLLTDNLCELMNDRSVVKAQFRADQTMISKGENNPFKFMAPAELASYMLGKGASGYLNAEDALEASFRSIRHHQMAVLGGMQKALHGLMDRLGPDAVEQRLGQRKTLSVLAKGGKKAAAWDEFRALHDSLQDEFTDMERSVFMSDFRAGYEDRIRHLDNADR